MSTFARGARRIGDALFDTRRAEPDAEDVREVVDEAGEWTVKDTAASVALDQPSRAVGRVAEEGTSTLRTISRGAVGLGAVGGGTYVGSKYVNYQERARAATENREQRALIEDILSDDTLTEEQRSELISLARQDSSAFQNPFDESTSTGNGNDSIVPNLPSLFSTEGIIMLIVLFFAGKALVGATRGGN